MMDNGCDKQLADWLNGNPVHDGLRDECCPDFSCCHPELLWPKERRQEFAAASDQERVPMSVMALRALLESSGHQVSGSWVAFGQEGDQ